VVGISLRLLLLCLGLCLCLLLLLLQLQELLHESRWRLHPTRGTATTWHRTMVCMLTWHAHTTSMALHGPMLLHGLV